jgi:hypothetical protein
LKEKEEAEYATGNVRNFVSGGNKKRKKERSYEKI